MRRKSGRARIRTPDLKVIQSLPHRPSPPSGPLAHSRPSIIRSPILYVTHIPSQSQPSQSASQLSKVQPMPVHRPTNRVLIISPFYFPFLLCVVISHCDPPPPFFPEFPRKFHWTHIPPIPPSGSLPPMHASHRPKLGQE